MANKIWIGTDGAFLDDPLETQIQQLEVNIVALTALTHAVLPGMVERKAGAVLNVASTAGFQPMPRQAVYAATKAPSKDNPLPPDAPFADIPASMSDPLVVLLPTGVAGPLAFRMLPVEFARAKAPEGAVVWLNLSTRAITSQLGSSRAVVAPRQAVIQLPSGRTGEVYPVSVVLAPELGETEGVPLMKSSWVKEPGQRHLLVVVPDDRRNVPRIIDIPESMEPESKPVKGAKVGAKKASSGKKTGK